MIVVLQKSFFYQENKLSLTLNLSDFQNVAYFFSALMSRLDSEVSIHCSYLTFHADTSLNHFWKTFKYHERWNIYNLSKWLYQGYCYHDCSRVRSCLFLFLYAALCCSSPFRSIRRACIFYWCCYSWLDH